MNLIERSRPQFEKILASLPDRARSAREETWRRMESMGLPNRRTETWKYSSLAAIEKVWTPDAGSLGQCPPSLMAWAQKQQNQFDVYIYEGARLIHKLGGDSGLTTLAVQESFQGEDGFANLTSALSSTADTLQVKKSSRPRPLLLIRYLSSPWSSAVQSIDLEDEAELEVVEILAGPGAPYYRGQLTQLNLGRGARLHWLRCQSEGPQAVHFSETQARLSAGSHLHWTSVHRGARFVRSQMRIDLNEVGAEAFVHGLTFADGDQQNDQRIVLQHLARETESEQLFKGIFGGRSKGTVNGKILIAQDAQKVLSRQMNHNLLLSKTAEANTKPELEIYADDVKANHGATVGRLDEEKLFYLQSRGLTATEAETLLSSAFAEDVYMKIPSARSRPFAEVNHVF